MKYAISELEEQLDSVLDKFCFYVEAGNDKCAERASDIADDFANALAVLKERRMGESIPRVA